MSKSREMQEFLDHYTRRVFGRVRTKDSCVACGAKVDGLKDEVSQREFEISGLCQECQDSVFN